MSEPDTLFPMGEFEVVPEHTGHASATCIAGQLAEMRLATEAAKQGFSVFFPIGHSHKADLVLWAPPSAPISVQVKKATWQTDGSFKFMVGSGRPSCAANPNNYGLRYKPYQKGDFDFLCAFIEEREEFVFYELSEIAGKSSLRWRPHNGRSANNWEILLNNEQTNK